MPQSDSWHALCEHRQYDLETRACRRCRHVYLPPVRAARPCDTVSRVVETTATQKGERMSTQAATKRVEIVHRVAGDSFNPNVFDEYGTDDMTLVSPHLGLDLRGKDAVREAWAKAVPPENRPTFKHLDDMEQGDLVVAFYQLTFPDGEERIICSVNRFNDDDRIEAVWTLKG